MLKKNDPSMYWINTLIMLSACGEISNLKREDILTHAAM